MDMETRLDPQIRPTLGAEIMNSGLTTVDTSGVQFSDSGLLQALCRKVCFGPRDVLREAGQHYRDMYLITEGTVVVQYRRSRAAQRGAGSSIGEIEFLRGCCAMVTVTARTATEGLVIDDGTLARLEAEQPSLSARLLRHLAQTAEETSGRNRKSASGAAAYPQGRAIEVYLCRNQEMLERAEATVAKWRATVAGTVHNIDTDMMHAAFDVISNTMLVGGAKDVLSAIEKGHADYYRGINWWVIYSLLKLPHWLPRPRGQSTRAHETRFRNAVAEVARQKSVDASTSQDLLGRLLRARDPETGQGMSEELVIDNVVSFMMAGVDTTALSLAWTLFLISRSPEWEGRMLEEIEHVVGSGPVKVSHVEQLHTVRQVLKESLRLFPTAPIILRDIVDDTELDAVTIPAGTISVIPIYAIHRHRSYWDDPDRFDPSRFSAKRDRDMRFQFMPFGAGPRICIGAAFAMMEATIMLATFVRAARFEVAPGFDPRPLGRMFLVARNGIPMRVTLRQNLS